MQVKVSVSLGELVDKITILKIKKEKIRDPKKLSHVQKELQELTGTLKDLGLEGMEDFENELISINSSLWEIEDNIREKEREKAFDEEFISLARSVYFTNDKRFEVKAKINSHFGSSFHEVKSYESYD